MLTMQSLHSQEAKITDESTQSAGNIMKSDAIFWNWFTNRKNDFFQLDLENSCVRDSLFDEFSHQLALIHPKLIFEFGPVRDGVRELIISADGDKNLFPIVFTLVEHAPKMDKWKFTALRPRQHPILPVTVNEITIKPEDVQFSLLSNGKIAGIQLFLPNMIQEDVTRKQIVYILLDSALGEYDMETRVGMVEMLSPESMTESDRYPFLRLPELFDRLVKTLPEGGLRSDAD